MESVRVDLQGEYVHPDRAGSVGNGASGGRHRYLIKKARLSFAPSSFRALPHCSLRGAARRKAMTQQQPAQLGGWDKRGGPTNHCCAAPVPTPAPVISLLNRRNGRLWPAPAGARRPHPYHKPGPTRNARGSCSGAHRRGPIGSMLWCWPAPTYKTRDLSRVFTHRRHSAVTPALRFGSENSLLFQAVQWLSSMRPCSYCQDLLQSDTKEPRLPKCNALIPNEVAVISTGSEWYLR
jgi:hypothetical protein